MKIKKKLNTWQKAIIIVIGIIFVFLLWWLLSVSLKTSLFPNPFVTFGVLGDLITKGPTWSAIGGTLYRLIVSFVLSFLAALIIGVFSGLFPVVKTFLKPIIIVLRTIPTAALIFVLIVLLRPKMSLFIIDFLLMFPILYEAVVAGTENIDTSVIDALRLETEKSNPIAITKIIVPMAWPYVILGIVQALGLGMKVSIMSEVLCGDDKIPGLGRMIYGAYIETNMPRIFALTLIAIILSGLLDVALSYVKKKYK